MSASPSVFSSPFVRLSKLTYSSTPVDAYLLTDDAPVETIRAAKQIRKLLRDNPNLIPTFEHTEPALSAALASQGYVTINNNRAVSLAEVRDYHPCSLDKFIDRYFSDTPIREPILCAQKHSMEKSRAQYWIRQHPNGLAKCPGPGEPHDLTEANLVIDEGLQAEIAEFNQKTADDMTARVNQHASYVQVMQQVTAVQAQVQTATADLEAQRVELLAAQQATRELSLITRNERLFNARPQTSLDIVRATGAFPVLSILFAPVLFFIRGWRGEWRQGWQEVKLALARNVPLMGSVVKKLEERIKEIDDISAIPLSDAGELLGIANPGTCTRAELNEAYRVRRLEAHPDRLGLDALPAERELGRAMLELLPKMKQKIEMSRGWK